MRVAASRRRPAVVGAMIHHASTRAELGRADLIAGAPTAVKYQILENAGGTVDA